MKLTNIVFTRNRPLQLEGYLQSFYRFMPRESVQTCILYKPDLFDEQYSEVFQRFSHCRVFREKEFNSDFLSILEQVETEYMNFGTDDVIYFDSVDLDVIRGVFEEFPEEAFGFSLRMSPESIDEKEIYSHKVDKHNVYSVNWKRTNDKTARYPFELNGTIYRTELVKEIISHFSKDKEVLKKIFNKDSVRVRILSKVFPMKNFLALLETFHNPNNLEGHCYRWVKKHKYRYRKKLFFQKLCCSAIQVNLVNTTVKNPIDGSQEHRVEALNEKFKQGYKFDIEALERNKPERTHVGREKFVLVKRSAADLIMKTKRNQL
jgi:hypothetical protein